jgi:hypothetical protein
MVDSNVIHIGKKGEGEVGYCHLRNLKQARFSPKNQLIFGSYSKSLIACSIVNVLLRFLYIFAPWIELHLTIVLKICENS